MTIRAAGWRSVLVRTYVYDAGTARDEREEVWRGPWPEVETFVKRGAAGSAVYVSLNHEGERWCSALAVSDDGWTCLGAHATRLVEAGELDPAEAFFSTSFTFVRGVTDRTYVETRALVIGSVDRMARWRAGDVAALLWKRIIFPGGVLKVRDPAL